MDADVLSNSHKLRAAVITWLSLILGITSFIFSAYNFAILNESLLAVCHLVFALYSLYLSLRSRQFQHTYRSILVFTTMLASIVNLATFLLPLENAVFVWSCFFPLFFYLLLGQKYGSVNSAVFFALQIAIITFKMRLTGIEFNIMILLNLSTSYFAIWLIAHLFESNRKKSELSLSVLASKDVLTNAYNRLALTHQYPILQRAENAPLSLLILDIDFFKQVNDQYGHSVGDMVLVETTKLLKKNIGESQVFRIGGEEFCITLPHTDLIQAERLAEVLRETIATHTFQLSSQPLKLTVSIGVCECSPAINLDEVLAKADSELYRAKKNGRNQVMVCSEQKKEAISLAFKNTTLTASSHPTQSAESD
ncbi:diguanylate cyclase [Vibrio sp. ZSDE26]|uniref:diguanylate cyclase n=1 Tax=Vibrio amylolyticus TaxID=2847292 RepID=A0A9X1XL84_9VIBR|nr:diguanylate cyclase [Vibrio amylolyticus]MCK6261654.1 diguanylate cyclase [Vibrio amylolyticus]